MSGSDALAALTDSLLRSGWRFRRPVGPPRDSPPTAHVYLCNVAGSDDAALEALGRSFGPLQRVTRCAPARGGEGDTYAAAVLSFASAAAAVAAVAALNGAPPLEGAPPGTRPLSARFAQLEPPQVLRPARAAPLPPLTPPRAQAEPDAEPEPVAAHRDAAALGIDGLWLLLNFVDELEERALLAHVDADETRWQHLARRRVLHEGFRFDYAVRRAALAAAELRGVAPDGCVPRAVSRRGRAGAALRRARAALPGAPERAAAGSRGACASANLPPRRQALTPRRPCVERAGGALRPADSE